MTKKMTEEQHAKKLASQKAYRQRNKEILALKAKEWAKKNPDKVKNIQKRYIENNKDKLSERYKQEWQTRKVHMTEQQREDAKKRRQEWVASNFEKDREIKRRWAKDHPEKRSTLAPEKRNAITAKRRAKKLQATPVWFGELDDFILREAYSLAKLREGVTGVKWHVDHIIPLQGKNVCGLHCWNNVQVIPALVNLSKGNSF